MVYTRAAAVARSGKEHCAVGLIVGGPGGGVDGVGVPFAVVAAGDGSAGIVVGQDDKTADASHGGPAPSGAAVAGDEVLPFVPAHGAPQVGFVAAVGDSIGAPVAGVAVVVVIIC